jgi:transposase-like protein
VFVVRQPDGTLTHVPCKTIFAQEAAQGAHAQWRSIADALRERAPKLAEVKDEAREDVLALFWTWRRHQPPLVDLACCAAEWPKSSLRLC